MKASGSLEVPRILQNKLEKNLFSLRIDKTKDKGSPSTGFLPENFSACMSTTEINRPPIPMKDGNLLVGSLPKMS
ncbi:uncharacterized protein Eint_061365 [Encephalitozoon intestinalis ATCC 50506]|uniref:Uncharacterized protein n=1 Tax=Encephalitozoon intestinalis (strain ATCC 50506) TaxID=876142 RepID=W8PGR6_ENCIT|nr:uncharacterized protein Eint_061365 [Encephalitozoon intestinalis ATCC 50506]AHL30121.1 hypothetical protein Eint_061365 [Encephalitozoon intestinalis ATCC 50506]UTX45481.1 hypothetical protein GPK93_06g10380 [Encephalitozoon intestinalis]